MPPQRNSLLARLDPESLADLEPHLKPIKLPLRFVIEEPGRQIEHAYFMEAGIASVVAVQSHQTQGEAGLIGPEGMTGVAILLGNHQSANSTYIQVAGEGQRISAAALRAALADDKVLQTLLLKYVHAFLVQTTHTAISNAHGHVSERLARWILMAHDRISSDTIPLTHEFLALMLGVRRAGVTEALHALVLQGLVSASRGVITVLDRDGLEQSAGDSYGVPEAEYRRLIGS